MFLLFVILLMVVIGVFLPRYIPEKIEREVGRGRIIQISTIWIKMGGMRGRCKMSPSQLK